MSRLSFLQRSDGPAGLSRSARCLPPGADAADARAGADGRRRFLVERDASRPDRSREQPGRGVVGQYQRHRRCRAGDHRDAGSSHRVGLARQCRSGRLFSRTRRRRSLDGRARGGQPALQGHGQSLRLGILDLSVAASRRTGEYEAADGGSLADRHRGSRTAWARAASLAGRARRRAIADQAACGSARHCARFRRKARFKASLSPRRRSVAAASVLSRCGA